MANYAYCLFVNNLLAEIFLDWSIIYFYGCVGKLLANSCPIGGFCSQLPTTQNFLICPS